VFIAATVFGLVAMRWMTQRIAELERLVPTDSRRALAGTVSCSGR
jgi:HAMP domain-containing protein